MKIDNPHKIEELKSFRIFKIPSNPEDKGVAIVKVTSIDKELCKNLQKVRSRYLIATAECYYNDTKEMELLKKYADYFDFHLVSCKRIKDEIEGVSKSKCMILGAGEYLTNPSIFYIKNTKERNTTFISLANSFWTVKNFHLVLELQHKLKELGITTTSKILCGSIKDEGYYNDCRSFIKRNLRGLSEIIIGSPVENLVDFYNDSKFVAHFSSVDSSPRVIFEGILSGCSCLVGGRWVESLNNWSNCPLIIKYTETEEEHRKIAEYKNNLAENKKYSSSIGLINIKDKIVDFCNSINVKISRDGFMDYSIAGKKTYIGDDKRYINEIKYLKTEIIK